MIVLKTGRELNIMKEACRISAGALQTAGKAVEPGVTTAEIDRLAEEYIRSQGGEPNFKNYEGYPATACISINKIDISSQDRVRELMAWWQEQLPKAVILPASAQERFNLDSIFNAILERLPLSPPWFDKDTFTDKNLRFFASEIIREKIFLNFKEEIPYSCQVEIEEFKEGRERYDIGAVIYVMRDSQKGIIIGKGGAALKKLGTQARIDMEDFFQKKVFLRLYVKVDPDWRENKKELKKFGYEF